MTHPRTISPNHAKDTLRICSEECHTHMTFQLIVNGQPAQPLHQNFHVMFAISTRGRKGISDLMNYPEETFVGPY